MKIDQISDFWASSAAGFSLSNMEQLTTDTRQKWIDRLHKYIPSGGGLSCLDAGCGPGFLAILLACGGNKVSAIDYTEDMLKHAQKIAQNEGVFIDFARMDAQNLEFPDSTFDVVVSRNVTWNLEFPERAYKEWFRVLKPGGCIVNFDGNHKLNKSNPLYQEFLESDAYVDPHKKEHIQGSKLSIMEEISSLLPLSFEERPAWDINILIQSCKASQIAADMDRVTFFSPSRNQNVSIIKDFCVYAQK